MIKFFRIKIFSEVRNMKVELKIEGELAALIPPLTEYEYKRL